MRVLKFGGTSLDGAQRIHRVAEIVGRAARVGRVTVVVSALAGVTDFLESAIQRGLAGQRTADLDHLVSRHLECSSGAGDAEEQAYADLLHEALGRLRQRLEGVRLLGECSAATRDQILATGERLTAPLVALELRRRGLRARAVDGGSVIATGPSETPAVDFAATCCRVADALGSRPADEVQVVTGFVAAGPDGQTTTLGRGASDYSATLLAAALDAQEVEIWSDVDGVLSADPRWVPEASLLPSLSYEQAMALAFFGARVLHPRALEPLVDRRIPLVLRNSLQPASPGTRVTAAVSESRVRAVTGIEEVVRYRIRLPAETRLGSHLAALDHLPSHLSGRPGNALAGCSIWESGRRKRPGSSGCSKVGPMPHPCAARATLARRWRCSRPWVGRMSRSGWWVRCWQRWPSTGSRFAACCAAPRPHYPPPSWSSDPTYAEPCATCIERWSTQLWLRP